ncbi:MAG: ATP-binding protein [Pseudomonadota bacterium]
MSYLGLYQVITGLLEIFIFNLAIIVLINSKNRILDILTLGTLFMITSNIWIKYLFLNQNAVNFDYSEFLNIIGTMLSLRAMFLLYKSDNRKISSWTNKSTSIKTQITLFVYIICIISFFCLFFLAKNLTIVNTNSVASFPVLIMAYSVVMVFLANIMGRKFEAPFKQLEDNTQTLLNLSQNPVNTDYDTDEFNKLQAFIIKQIKSQNILNYNVIKAVHDFKSPLTLMGEIINSLEEKIPNDKFNRLNKSLTNLRQITTELLDQHRKQIQHANKHMEPAYCLLYNLIGEVVDQKNIEWKENPCHINIKFISIDIIWVYVIDIEFKNIISNLLNNAYESMYNEKNDIEIIIESQLDNTYTLIIKDRGCGIPQDELLHVLNGKSLKEKGNGIGLSSATKYLSTINGSLALYSQEDKGTSVEITIPKTNTPKWFTNTIHIKDTSQIVIVDDDASIHIKWQKLFISTGIRPLYFLNPDQFISWFTEQENNSNIIVLMDYELGKNYETGLAILKKFNINNAYLTTSHAEQSWIQDLISQTNYHLIPKSLIERINIKVHNR